MDRRYEKCMDICKRDNELICKGARIHYYPLAVKSACGSEIEDMDGNRYIDFFSSAAVANTGHSHPAVVRAIKKQLDSFVHYTNAYMYNEAQVELARRLVEITPGDFEKRVFFGMTGSDANDGAIKLARAYTGRKNIISFIKAYHGTTFGALSLSAISLNMRRNIGPTLGGVHHIPYPDCFRCPMGQTKEKCNMECIGQLEYAFENFLPAEDVAAVIMEPLAGDAGIVVPPIEYVKRLSGLCRENGILFISEEVQQGFGRTGKWFGIENFDVEPDVVIMGKAMASGMPISAVVARKEIMDALPAPAHIFTMNGNPVCCSAAIATIDTIKEEGLVERAEVIGEYIRGKLESMKNIYDIIGDIRGIGLSIGVELVKGGKNFERNREAATKISYRCWENGLILTFFAGNVLRFQPPLVIEKEQVDRGFEILQSAIEDYVGGNIPDSVLEESKGW